MTEDRVPPVVENLIRMVAGGSGEEREERASTFARGLALGALVGAAIAGSTIWQRKVARDRARAAALELQPEPAFEPEPEPAFEPNQEPAFEPEPEPAFEPDPEPAFEPNVEPALEPERSTAAADPAVPAIDPAPPRADA
jgi:hypothetical protein